jgi:hypothetical protein
MPEQFLCHAEHREDLTGEVRRQLKDRAGIAVRSFGRKPKKWAVIVYCTDNHKNIFEGEGEP